MATCRKEQEGAPSATFSRRQPLRALLSTRAEQAQAQARQPQAATPGSPGARRGPGSGAAAPAPRSTYPISCCRRARVSWRSRCAGLMAALPSRGCSPPLLASLPGRCRCCCPRRAAPARRSPAPAAPPAGCGAGSTALGCLVIWQLLATSRLTGARGGLVGAVTEPALRERSPWPPAHSQTPAQACR